MDALLASKFQGKNILWIEDDQFLGSMVEKRLRLSGVNLTHDVDGESAIKTLQGGAVPDLVMIDIILPGAADGFAILKALREDPRTKDVPAVILSNLSSDSDKKKATDLGANLYLVKASLTLDEILERIVPLFK